MNPEDRLKEMFDAARGEGEATDSEWRGFSRRAHRALLVRRAAVGAGALSLVVVGALGFALLGPNGDRPGPQPATTASPDPSENPTPPDPEPTETPTSAPVIEVEPSHQEQWYAQEGGGLSWGSSSEGGEVLVDVVPADDPVAARAAFWIQRLLGLVPGPVAETGGSSAIPEGTKLLKVSREGSQLTIDMKIFFSAPRNSEEWMELALAQLVFTATQFEGIDSVAFGLRGGADGGFAGSVVEEAIRGKVFTRRDFQDVAPSIVAETPKPNAELTSGFEVAGFANVFEATVSIRLEDADGKKLAETFATATCGTGCWGDFTETVEFEVDEPQEGRLMVFTYSAEDGSEQIEAYIPVRLVP